MVTRKVLGYAIILGAGLVVLFAATAIARNMGLPDEAAFIGTILLIGYAWTRSD